MLRGLDKSYGGLSISRQYLLGLVLLAVIGFLDLITGTEISFSVFYLIPVALVAWYAGKTAGSFICVISALIWFVVEFSTNQSYTQTWIPYWNTVVRLLFFLVTANLLSQLKVHHEREQAMLRIDALTGARSFQSFKEAFRLFFKLAVRHRHPIALATVSLDNFKFANETMGSAEGDRILQTVVMALTLSVRSTDIVGRIEGEDFAIVFPQTGMPGAKQSIDKLHLKLLDLIRERGWPIGLSIGVVVFYEYPANYSEALKYAENMCQRIKTTNAGNVVYEAYQADMK